MPPDSVIALLHAARVAAATTIPTTSTACVILIAISAHQGGAMPRYGRSVATTPGCGLNGDVGVLERNG
jgi:hypothetical protein